MDPLMGESASASDHVRDEALTLGRFRRSFGVRELFAIRRYAWRRSAFPKPAAHLSDKQIAWRETFSSFDDLLRQTIGQQKKAELDTLEIRGQNLGLAARMLEYRHMRSPAERPIAEAIFVTAFVIGSALGWFLGRSIWVGLAFAVTFATAAILGSIILLQDSWSSSKVAFFLNVLGRWVGSDHIRKVAARLVESNVLHSARYYETGDPARAAELLRRFDEHLVRQGSALLNAIGILQSDEYAQDVRVPEKAAVDPLNPAAARFAQAQLLVQASDRFCKGALVSVEGANDECEIDLFELENQIQGLPGGLRHHKFTQWSSAAKSEYLHGVVITNILRNWFEMDVDIARQVVASEGNVNFTIEAEPIAETFAQIIEALPQLLAERVQFRATHEALKRELLGLLA